MQSGIRADRSEQLKHAIEHVGHVLPAQGPIGTFIHHNTLHAFQHLPFHDANRAACDLYGARGYLDEARYREALGEGRITEADLDHALAKRERSVPDRPVGSLSLRRIEKLVLEHGIDSMCTRELDHEGKDRALYAACQDLLARSTSKKSDSSANLMSRVGRDRTHRDLFIRLGAPDPAETVNDVLIPFLASYLDEGIARWSMPGRERGLLSCFIASESVLPSILAPWRRRALERLRAASAHTVIVSVLDELAVPAEHWDSYLARVAIELPGWHGMVARLESHPSDRGPNAPPASLLELLAIRLALTIESEQESAHAMASCTVLSRDEREKDGAFRLFQLCQLGGVTATELLTAKEPDALAQELIGALDAFDEHAVLETFHDAYEHHHESEQLAAIFDNLRHPAYPEPTHARFQVVFCIDDREEAIRRHFEELDPRHVTFGVAGFYGIPMKFRAIDDHRAHAQCPAVVRPTHTIEEHPHPEHASWSKSRRRWRERLIANWHSLAHASRSLLRGAALTPVLGLALALPLALRTLFPRATAALAHALTRRVLPPPRSRLAVTREAEQVNNGDPENRGFSPEECASMVRTTFENIGLVSGFAPLVVVLGHGASSTNNPHYSAYECGACGGRSGGPNARAFAAMANDRRVREILRKDGLDIPESTHVVGGVHDTTRDSISLFDLECVPSSLASDLEALEGALSEARGRSAHERCRRFEHAPSKLDTRQALAHVEERAVDLAQARPELGHATNAACVVGRRALTRGLFLDRRALLVSYDPTIDPDGVILSRVLAAALPVCAGISLEYFFSTVDDEVWGAGTKLPHNLASLLGVMEGSSGDLRTGLPRQMTEVHEPVRLLSIIEASPERLFAIINKNQELGELVRNAWIRLVSVDPVSGAMSIFGQSGFEPFEPGEVSLPRVETSEHWYAGKRDFIRPARIEPSKALGRLREVA